jgi:hypothetical protein
MGKYLSLDGDITFLEIIPIALSKASSLASVLQAELAL